MDIDYIVLILSALPISLLIEYPLLYARIRNKPRWLPINAPPWMLGDDYHYYSILNNFHKILLRVLGKKIDIQPISRLAVLQPVGYLINLLPYHIGFIIEDKRMGVLFVKIWNRVFLFLAVSVFVTEIYRLLGKSPSVFQLMAIFLAYFCMYPGPWSTNRNTLLWGFRDPKFMFHWVHVNDFTRGMHSETTAPLLLLLSGITLRCLSLQPDFLPSMILLFSIVLFLQYFPVFTIYMFFGTILCTYKGLYMWTGLLAASYLGLSIIYSRVLNRCPVSNELIVHNDGGKFFRFNNYYLKEFLLMAGAAICIFFLFGHLLALIFISFAVFVGTLFLYKHQFSRFWDRGALIISQLLVIIFFSIFIDEFNSFAALAIYGAIIFSLIIVAARFFMKNALYLYLSYSTRVPERISDKTLRIALAETETPKIYVTDSLEIAYYIGLYSNNSCLLKNYSIQTRGYEEHLYDLCRNFKAIGFSLQNLIALLTNTPSEWRSVESRERVDNRYQYFHEAQYMATNYRFNRKIIDDGMYVDGIWTIKYKGLIKAIWKSIETKNMQNLDAIITQ